MTDRHANKRVKLSPNANAYDPRWPGWCLLESEPALFNRLLRDIGVTKAQVEELYSLDEDSLRAINPAYGMIFLFRWKSEPTKDEIETTCPEGVWFANQVIDNACASLALLNIVYNCKEVGLGPQLEAFREYSGDLTPPMKGLAVANFAYLREIHNTFGRKSDMMDADVNLADASKSKTRSAFVEDDEDESVFHFIAYVHIDGTLWELDGLKRQPVKIEDCSKEEWLSLAGKSAQARINRYNDDELRFTMLAVVPERVDSLRRELKENQVILGLTEKRLDTVSPNWREEAPHESFQYETHSAADGDLVAARDYVEPNGDATMLIKQRSILITKQSRLKRIIAEEEDRLCNYEEIAEGRLKDYETFFERMNSCLARKNLPRAILA